MNLILLYFLLLKAMMTSFSGPTSLPVVRQDLVVKHHVITDSQLAAAVAAGRATPGPFGLYLVSVGYHIDGIPGAIAGLLALITPAFLIVPMLKYLGHGVNRPVIRSAIRAVTLAAAGLLVSTTVPLARECLTGRIPVLIAVGTFAFLVLSKRSTIWVVLGGAAAGLLGGLLR
jgi:chromate transporter